MGMRLILIAMLATACGAFAQRGGGHGGYGHGPGGYGGPVRVSHTHAGVAIVPYPVFYGGYSYYYDPSMVDGGYGGQPAPGYDSGYAGAPGPGYADPSGANGGPSQPPVIIINQSFHPDSAAPVLHDYSNSTLPQPGPSASGAPSNVRPDDQPTIYLIAMKDHTIFPAVAYWVEGDTLNYITTEGSQNRASLALVDRDFSAQLNNERHVEFKLPAPK